jgi:ligand-binding sensor domain-containing protein
MKQLITVFFLFILVLSSFAQEYSYRHYTVQDGLAQSQVMYLFQDSKGFIWASTKGGVSRFDGISFVNYNQKDGMLDHHVELMLEDQSGTIWFLSPDGLACYDGKKITGFPTEIFRNNHGLVAFYEISPGILTIVYTNKRNQVVYLNFFQGVYETKNTIFDVNELIYPFYLNIGVFDKKNQTQWLASNTYGLVKIQGENIQKIDFKIESLQAFRMGKDDKLYLMANNKVFTIQHDSLHEVFTNNIPFSQTIFQQFTVDKNGVIYWDNSLQDKLCLYNDDKFITENYRFLVINDLMIDRENNLWIGSETGLYRMISRAFVNYIPEKSGIKNLIWSVLEDKKGNIWFSSLSEGLQYFDGKKFITVDSYKNVTKDLKFDFYMGSIVDHKGDLLFTTTDFMGLKYNGRIFSKMHSEKFIVTTLFFFEDPDNKDLYAGTTDGLYRISTNGTRKHYKMQPGNGKSRNVVSIVKDRYKRFWLGGFNGISLLINDSVIHLPTKEIPFEEGGNAMLIDSLKNIWIGNADGLTLYNYATFQKIEDPKLQSTITSLAMISDSALLIGSANGLALLDLKAYYANAEVKLTFFGEENGFQGIEIGQNAIVRDSKGYYWIPTSDRVVRFDPRLYKKNEIPPSTYISSVSLLNNRMEWEKVNGEQEYQNGKERTFEHTEKNLRFEFTGISTSASERVKYSHLLEGYDMGWSQPENDRFAVYTNLSPGKYNLMVKACNADGYWTPEAVYFSFRIIPAFYQRAGFWVVCLMVAASLLIYLGFIISGRKRLKQRNQLETENKIARLQLLTIQNQMDPHFTFNAINSIASIVLKEDKENAYRFFVKLANLMRRILNTSDNLLHSLGDEIDFVTDYLDFQKLRYKDEFIYNIHVSQGINLTKKIPKMTIQTFAENALKHGLLHADYPGKLNIRITEEDENLNIVIEDNGIGRTEAKRMNIPSTGRGIGIVQGYFDYFNRKNQLNLSYDIVDLFDDQGIDNGTRVIVKIPGGNLYFDKN